MFSNIAFTGQIAFFMLSIVLAYWFWLRPILKSRSGCAEFYAKSESILGAVRLRFQGIKGHLATGIAKAAAVVVLLHDQLIPYITQVDWAPITASIPGWAWPLLMFGAFWFVGQCRSWAEARS